MAVFGDSTIAWGGFNEAFDITSKIVTCVKPDGFDAEAEDVCPGGPGTNHNSSGDGPGGNQGNPSIYGDDGKVKPAGSAVEVWLQIFACEDFGQVMDVLMANFFMLFKWF